MSLTLASGLQAHYRSSATALARLLKVTRRDGSVVLRVTDFDADIQMPGDGLHVSAAAGFNASAVRSNANLAVDNLEIGGLFSAVVAKADLLAGLWDNAAVLISECVWADPTLGARPVRGGRLGKVTYDGETWRAELLGLTEALQANLCRVVSPACDAILGDARCGKNLAAFTHALTVTAVTSRRQFAASALAQAAGYFDFGLVQWATGANAGASHEIKQHLAGGALTLFLPAPYAIAVGDTGSVIAGCDKTRATCRDKFANVAPGANQGFRGYPDAPSDDKVFVPQRG